MDLDLEVSYKLRRQKRLFSFLTSKHVPPLTLEEDRRLYKGARFWHNFGFFWVYPLVILGYKRTVQPEDLYYLPKELQIDHVYTSFMRYFVEYNERAKQDFLMKKQKLKGNPITENKYDEEEDDLADYKVSVPTGLKALYATFKWRYSICVVAIIISSLLTTLSSLLNKRLINYVSLKSMGIEEGIGKGVGYALGLSFMLLLSFVLQNTSFYFSTLVGDQIKALITKAILHKSFKADAKSKHEFSASKLTSLANTDVSKIEMAVAVFPLVLAAPVGIVVSFVLLAVNLGVTMLVSIAVYLIFMVSFVVFAKFMISNRIKSLKFTDQRINFTKEIVNYLKVIKLYSWEDPYYKTTELARKNETKHLANLQFFRNLLFVSALSSTPIATLVTFLALFFVDDSRRSAANVFASVTVLGFVGDALMQIPMVLGTSLDALISLGRVFAFLGSSEVVPDEDFKVNEDCLPLDSDPDQTVIEVNNGQFAWEVFPEIEDVDEMKKKKKAEKKEKSKTSGLKLKLGFKSGNGSLANELENKKVTETIALDPFRLKDINLRINKGEFIMITGVVGSGKSSLLNALYGLMKREAGCVEINGSSVLCDRPWVQNATFKDNITFGLPYDEKKYAQTIFACALNDDLQGLPAADLTEIGENGITLSGGQKSRLNLARAIYADRDIVLLDDVLSAVDARVGKHIMESGLLGILKEKTRILATHQLSFLSYADKVIFLNDDNTIDYGTVDELITRNSGFNKLVSHNDKDHKEKDDDNSNIEEKSKKEESLENSAKPQDKQQEIMQADEKLDTSGKLVEEEISAENSIKWSIYMTLLKLGSGRMPPLLVVVIALFATLLGGFLSIFNQTWLSFWTENRFTSLSPGAYIGIYAALSIGSVIATLAQFSVYVDVIIRASRRLNVKAINTILHVPMAFMDTTPTGRILNRFTKDTDAIDNSLLENFRILLYIITHMLATVVLSIAYLPWLAVAFPFLLLATCYVSSYFQASSREIRRLESVQRSFVLNNFSECLSGLDVIKSYRSVDRFLESNSFYLDKTNEAGYMLNAIQRWGGFNIAAITTLYIILVSLLGVGRVFNISAASIGLVIANVVAFPDLLASTIKVMALFENDMTSFERVSQYCEGLPSESAYRRNDTAPEPSWPSKGAIEFDNVCLRYRPGLPKVLKNVSFSVKPNERVGICGRTGAGKSTITGTLFRLTELCEGSIKIDGIDISHLGLNELRSKLSIIPQESVLFGGTIRKNLDPFQSVEDEVLWSCLRRAGLIDSDSLEDVKQQTKGSKDFHKFHLDNMVETDGTNFSLGEKQLISFARALVKNSKILVLDEATSSVDYETDSKIQHTIATEFKHCTILSIAHRLKTIINYDKILVLDGGEVKEFDSPLALFDNESTIFRHLCDKSKLTRSDFQT